APSAVRARMAAPLLADPRLEQRPDGRWTVRGANPVSAAAFTALAVVATGPTPGRARVVRVSALHVDADAVVGRFDVTLDPQRRVPRYVEERIGLESEVLNGQPQLQQVLDELMTFLGD